jgi:penicillin-binding protein 2
VAVIAEHGGGGSATAAPLARRVMDAYLLDKYDDTITAGIESAQDAQPHGTE